jgi:hypothetical protein
MFLFLLILKFFMGLPEPQEGGERSKAVIDVVHRILTLKEGGARIFGVRLLILA